MTDEIGACARYAELGDITVHPEKVRGTMKTYQKILAIVAIALMFVLSACGDSGQMVQEPTQAPTQAQADQTQAQAPTNKQQVEDWIGKYSYIIQSLSNDLSSIGTDGTNNDVAGMNAHCTQLQTDVATAQGFPAIPDAQTASDWSSGLTYLASGTQDCIDGTANYDAGLVSKAATEFDKATAKINAATNDIIALTNQ